MPNVTVLPSGVRVRTSPGETVVDGLRRAGWRTPYKCRRGGCGVCKAHLVQGAVHYALPVAGSVLSDAELAGGLCLPCRAIPATDVVIDVGGQPLRAVLASLVPGTTTPAPQEGR
jgi:ferredoxin